jgi:hypothetical protein
MTSDGCHTGSHMLDYSYVGNEVQVLIKSGNGTKFLSFESDKNLTPQHNVHFGQMSKLFVYMSHPVLVTSGGSLSGTPFYSLYIADQ